MLTYLRTDLTKKNCSHALHTLTLQFYPLYHHTHKHKTLLRWRVNQHLVTVKGVLTCK